VAACTSAIHIVAYASVNCDDAVDIGLAAASGMDDKKFTDVTLRRKDKVSTIGGKNNTVKAKGQNTEVNPSLLFNRIMCVLNKVLRWKHSLLKSLLLSHLPFSMMV